MKTPSEIEKLVPTLRALHKLLMQEDLIILKAVAHRPKDMLDITNLIEIYPKLDHTRIEKWVREYAELMEMPELWTDLRKLLRAK